MARLTNAQKQANFRAKKKAEKLAAEAANMQKTGGIAPGAGETVVPPVGEDEGIQVDVKAPTPTPQLSLKDRFMARLNGAANSPAPAKKPARGKKADTPNLITSVLPTVTASLVAVYAQDLLPEEYRPCAPTKEEVASIIGPLFDILGRQVEIVGKASQTTLDLINSLVAAFAYGTRAYITYVDIRREKESPGYAEKRHEAYRAKLDREAREYESVVNGGGSSSGSPEREPISLAGGLRAYQATASGYGRDATGGNGSTAYEPATQTHDERREPATEDGDTERRRAEAALVNDLFKRDRGGRVRLGLLPA